MCSVWPEAGELTFEPWVAPVSSSKPIPLHRPEWIQRREEARQKTLARRKRKLLPRIVRNPSKVRVSIRGSSGESG